MANKAGRTGNDKTEARGSRWPTELRGMAVLEDGSKHPVLVTDLHYDGCAIEIPAELEPLAPVRLSIPVRGAIDAKVRWYADGKAGLAFTGHLGADPGRRSTERTPLNAHITAKRPGRLTYLVGASDASPEGVQFTYVDRPEVGEPVTVKFDGLQPLEATVRWVEGKQAGVSFDRPIHPKVFELLSERNRLGGEEEG